MPTAKIGNRARGGIPPGWLVGWPVAFGWTQQQRELLSFRFDFWDRVSGKVSTCFGFNFSLIHYFDSYLRRLMVVNNSCDLYAEAIVPNNNWSAVNT